MSIITVGICPSSPNAINHRPRPIAGGQQPDGNSVASDFASFIGTDGLLYISNPCTYCGALIFYAESDRLATEA